MKSKITPAQTSFYTHVALDKINVSPHNDGRGDYIDPIGLKELAESIKAHGVIQAVLLRPVGDKFELVVGERRFRASKIAGRKEIKAEIRELSDEEVLSIQIIENFQREQPHAMVEALAFAKMLSFKTKPLSVDEIGAKIGKSPSYVYQRIKLTNLIESLRPLFIANKFTHTEALRLARLDHESQTNFYNNYCEDWQDEDWEIYGFDHKIHLYQLSLEDAPFNIKDAKLDRAAGACTKCPNNTAVTTSLFPDDSKDARCTNQSCYQNKCKIASKMLLSTAINLNSDLPIAITDDQAFFDVFSANDTLLTDKKVLIAVKDYFNSVSHPELPIQDDFNFYDDEEENKAEFDEAMAEYKEAVEQLESDIASGKFIKAISGDTDSIGSIIFLQMQPDPEHKSQYNYNSEGSNFRAKDYQDALKAKSLTPEIIEAEKRRILAREERNKEIDHQKLQDRFVEAFVSSVCFKNPQHPVGGADRMAMIFILFNSIGYWKSRDFRKLITRDVDDSDTFDIIQFAKSANDQELSLLIRHALMNISEVKTHGSDAAMVLKLVVELTPGMNAQDLIAQQQEIADDRWKKTQTKLSVLDKQTSKFEKSVAL